MTMLPSIEETIQERHQRLRREQAELERDVALDEVVRLEKELERVSKR